MIQNEQSTPASQPPIPAVATVSAGQAFTDLGLIDPLLKALADAKHVTPTPIQLKAIPHAIAGKDVLGIAQTGTGKTAAFALPILQKLSQPLTGAKPTRNPRALILSPTRELATQISRSFELYGRYLRLRHLVVYGGVNPESQARALHRGVDILVATPGRLFDLIQQRVVSLANIEVFVLDEADRMLDEGFLPDVRRIVERIPEKRQVLFFSATMPPSIQPLADRLLKSPVRVEATPVASTPNQVNQLVYHIDQQDKRALLQDLLADKSVTRAIVFTRTKHAANRVSELLVKKHIRSAAIHGNKSQSAREKALDEFRRGAVRVLVATDIAARGIDVSGISHVINYDIPTDPEAYVHRIGRTARAGSTGSALSFCSNEERNHLKNIERLLKKRVPVAPQKPAALAPAPAKSA